MIQRFRTFFLPRRHPREWVLSQYLEGDLDQGDRNTLEIHLRGCARCRRLLASLAGTVRALGSIEEEVPSGLADSIIAALRAESPLEIGTKEPSASRPDVPVLTVVGRSGQLRVGDRAPSRARRGARGLVRHCVRWAQLRVTVPIAVLIGLALSFTYQARMLVRAPLDITTWIICAPNFLLPFIGVNIGLLLIATRRASRERL